MINCKLRFNGEDFGEINESNHRHVFGQLGNYKGKAFVTGCIDWSSTGCGTKTEILDMGSMTWSDAYPDFPYAR